MKIVRSKGFLTLVTIVFIIGFSSSAKTISINSSFISFLPGTVTAITGEANPLFVSYPESLKDHRKETKEYIKGYSEKKRNYIVHIFNKGKKFFPKAIVILEKYGVPLELQMLPILESEFNANAVSNAGAVGYWQFMGELAKEYGLHTGGNNDERKNFTKSTIAAAKFFRDQLDYFNDDILLAVSAYNCGTGRVRFAIKKSGKSNADYWDIKDYLPAETRKFVMNFISLNVISLNYSKFIDRKLDFSQEPLVQLATLDSTKSTESISGIIL